MYEYYLIKDLLQSSQFGHTTLQQLAKLRDREILCDVVLVSGWKRINAHRVVLSACSTYFLSMFTSQMSECYMREINIENIDPLTLEALIEFCYSGLISIDDSNVQDILPAACLLQLHEVQTACCEYLKKQLDPSNCLGIRAFADTHACKELLSSADEFALKNFSSVIGRDEFLFLTVDSLSSIIRSDRLNAASEEIVFSAVIQWVRHDIPKRKLHLPMLLSHVRLPLCTPKFLVSVVSEEVLVKSDPLSRDLVDEAKNYLLLPVERPNMQGPRTKPRKPLQIAEMLYAVGGWCSGDAIASVERMDPIKGGTTWKCVAPMGKRRCGVGVAVLENLLYAVGGHDGQSYLNSIERYDPMTNQWCSEVAPTATCRTSVGVAAFNGSLYAVGGQDGESCLDVVEKYDPRKTNGRKWLVWGLVG
uniref:BTB domain-containing protein n=1 Tax=Caenorhabditis tropicalis TaxID=1561998 RepID=A0A1I7TK06_9PELO